MKKNYKLFTVFLKFASNFKLYEKNDKPHRVCIFEIRDCSRPGQLNILKSRLRKLFDNQRAKGTQTLPKSARQHFYHILLSFRAILNWKTSLLVTAEILGLFNHTLTTEDKHSIHNKERLTQPTQIYLFKKQKSFVTFFVAFLKSASNFKHFLKRASSRAYVFQNFEIAKDSQTLLKSTRQHFYQIFQSLSERLS